MVPDASVLDRRGYVVPFLRNEHVTIHGAFELTCVHDKPASDFWGPPMRIGTSCEIAAITLI